MSVNKKHENNTNEVVLHVRSQLRLLDNSEKNVAGVGIEKEDTNTKETERVSALLQSNISPPKSQLELRDSDRFQGKINALMKLDMNPPC